MIGEERGRLVAQIRLNVALNARPVVRHKRAVNSGRLIPARRNATRGSPLRPFRAHPVVKDVRRDCSS
jgi:hypothetical protein